MFKVPHVVKLLLATIVALSVWLVPAYASFHLEPADEKDGISLPSTVLAVPRGHVPYLPKPRPVVKVAGISQTNPAPSHRASGVNWECVLGRESGDAPLGCAHHCGRLQWLPSTWRAAGGTRYAPLPQQATREQELAVAASWVAGKSQSFLYSQWPTARGC